MSGMNSRRGMAAPAPARERKCAYEIEKGLRQSLESVDMRLKKFLLSLTEPRMVGALQEYRAQQMTLVQ